MKNTRDNIVKLMRARLKSYEICQFEEFHKNGDSRKWYNYCHMCTEMQLAISFLTDQGCFDEYAKIWLPDE